jgi:hypothetical protein
VNVARYPIGGCRELRVTQARGLLFLSVHDGDRCTSGPLGVPVEAVETLRSALGDVLGEHGTDAATDAERPTTSERRSERGMP